MWQDTFQFKMFFCAYMVIYFKIYVLECKNGKFQKCFKNSSHQAPMYLLSALQTEKLVLMQLFSYTFKDFFFNNHKISWKNCNGFWIQVAGTIRNCCFEAESQVLNLLLISEFLWPALLLPVAGNKVTFTSLRKMRTIIQFFLHVCSNLQSIYN